MTDDTNYITEEKFPYRDVHVWSNGDLVDVRVRADPTLTVEPNPEIPPYIEFEVWTRAGFPGISLDLPPMHEDEVEALIKALQDSLQDAREAAAKAGYVQPEGDG